jgi:hypothetical protein
MTTRQTSVGHVGQASDSRFAEGLGRPRFPDYAERRFWPRVAKAGADDCWEWQGPREPAGYGRLIYQGNVRAHRVAWFLTYGPIPKGLAVCHHCDNPPCCNPGHLYLTTQSQNIKDRARKGRTSNQFLKARGVTV